MFPELSRLMIIDYLFVVSLSFFFFFLLVFLAFTLFSCLLLHNCSQCGRIVFLGHNVSYKWVLPFCTLFIPFLWLNKLSCFLDLCLYVLFCVLFMQ